MDHPTKITVAKAGQTVFEAEAGRLGYAHSARNDFLCFASPIIGAAYTSVLDAAERIAQMGYSTTIEQGGTESTVPATH